MNTATTSFDNGGGLATSPFTSVQGAADAAQTAQEGAKLLAEFWIEQGVCFTSGHIVNALREARGKSLMVNQRPTGQVIQQAFEDGDLPSYDDGFGGSRPMRKLRATTRTDTRTPVGTEVYVYGPSEDEIDLFEFEINIAEAPMVNDGMGGQTSAATALLNATPNVPASDPNASPIPPVQPSGKVAIANGKMVPGTPIAAVHSDGRLCLPRIAFEALAFETGVPVVGGEALYVSVLEDGNIFISQQNQSESVDVRPTTDRLRLHLALSSIPKWDGHLVNFGDEFDVLVSEEGLTVKLRN